MQIGPSRRAYRTCMRLSELIDWTIDQLQLDELCILREMLSKRLFHWPACSRGLLGSTERRLPDNKGLGVFGLPRELGSPCSMPSFQH